MAAALRTYCSDVGKAGLAAMDEIWDSEGMKGQYVTKEQRKAWVDRNLEKKRFLYLDMDSKVCSAGLYFDCNLLTS